MEWISVKDKLPEKDQKVLFCDIYNIYEKTFWGVQIGNYNGENWFSRNQLNYTRNVSHWMPLPELPEEEISNADHRKQRGRTAPNGVLGGN